MRKGQRFEYVNGCNGSSITLTYQGNGMAFDGYGQCYIQSGNGWTKKMEEEKRQLSKMGASQVDPDLAFHL